MKIRLMKCEDSFNVLNKETELVKEVDIIARNDFKITTPILKLSVINGVDFMTVNYVEIPELNRFYFVDSVQQVSGKIFQLNLTCDVLSSFKDVVKGCYASVNRAVKDGDFFKGDLDTSYKTQIDKYESNKELESGSQIFMSTVGAK